MHLNLNDPSRALRFVAAALPLIGLAASTRADIFQWEYIDPSDPSQGKRQSTTLAPDGAGVDAVPGAALFDRDLTMAYLISADVANANGFRSNLTEADLSHATLTNANFRGATLTGASFVGAGVQRAVFSRICTADLGERICSTAIGSKPGSGVTLAQLYSTASYQARDLNGIDLYFNRLAGGNFANQNLTNANFAQVTLTGSNFSGADLTNADFRFADLSGADFRGANLTNALSFANANITNQILHNGHISGLNLDSNGLNRLLEVRDHDGRPEYGPVYPPIPITVDEHLWMGPGGTLRMVFEADAWDSTISFAPGISVTLGGTLELTFAADVNLASQVGRTLKIFDWTGVAPAGAFAVSSPYRWDRSNLYTTGEVTLAAIPEPPTLWPLCLTLAVTTSRRLQRDLFSI